MENGTPTECEPVLVQASNVSAEKHGWPERAVCYVRENKGKLCSTLNVYLHYIAFSWMYSVLGPSLPDLQFILDIDLSKASWIFTCQALGVGVGCAVHGLLYDRLHILVLMATYSFLAGLMWIATPWCNLFWLMLVIRVVGGIFVGCMDASALARLFSIWGLDIGPYSQVLYLMFGAASICAALIVEQFILPETIATDTFVHSNQIKYLAHNATPSHDTLSSRLYNATSSYDAISSLLYNATSSLKQPLPGHASGQPPVSRIYIPYLISGCIALLSGATLILEYNAGKNSALKLEPVETPHSHESSKIISRKKISKTIFWTAIVIMSLINLILNGVVETYMWFLSSYLIHQLNWSPPNGAFGTSVFYVAFTAGNILAMCLALFMTTRVLIAVSVLTGVVFSVGLILSGYYLSNVGTWVCVIGLGLSMAPQWPVLYTFVEEEIASLSGRLASLIMTTGAVGMLLNPLLVGNTMASIAPISFGYVLLFEFILICVLYLFVFYLYRNRVDAYERFHE